MAVAVAVKTSNLSAKTKKKAKGALVVLLLETGLRIGEAKSLKRHQLANNRLRSVLRKGYGLQDVRLSKEALMALNLYLESRTDNDPRLFLGNVKTLYRWVVEVGHIAGLEISPHMLRHTFAMRLLRKTKDIRFVQQMMHHKSPKATMIYTVRNDEEIYEVLDSQDDESRYYARSRFA
jgi:integrase